MQEQSKTPTQPKLSKTENLNRPNWKRFVLQGRDRFLARIHQEVEQKTPAGIIIKRECQTIPSTGTVVALSQISEDGLRDYPDVKIGANIQVAPNAWTTLEIDGETMATGILDYVVATYEFPEDESRLSEIASQQEDDQRVAMEKMKADSTTFTGSSQPVPSLIRVR